MVRSTSVLFFNTSPGWGGLELNTIKLVQHLNAAGVFCHVVCRKNSIFEEQCIQAGIYITPINDPKKYVDFSNARTISRKVSEMSITHLFVTNHHDLDLATQIKWRKPSIKLIFQQHMQVGVRKKNPFQRLRFRAVDFWISPSDFLIEDTLKHTTIPRSKIHKIPLGIDGDAWKTKYNMLSKENVRAELNLGLSDFVIGVLGRIDPQKGQLLALKVIKSLLADFKGLKLLIVGSPTPNNVASAEYNDILESFISSNKLEEIVVKIPSISSPEKFYRAIDLVLIPSQNESYGMVALEAMALDIPIVANPVAGLKEFVGNNERGLTYEPNDVKSCIEVLFNLIHAENFQSLTPHTNAAYVEANYSLAIEISGILNLLNA